MGWHYQARSTVRSSAVNKYQQHQDNLGGNAENRIRGCWLWSKYATSVLRESALTRITWIKNWLALGFKPVTFVFSARQSSVRQHGRRSLVPVRRRWHGNDLRTRAGRLPRFRWLQLSQLWTRAVQLFIFCKKGSFWSFILKIMMLFFIYLCVLGYSVLVTSLNHSRKITSFSLAGHRCGCM